MPTFGGVSSHFAQLVWKATEEIGVGRAFGTKWGMNCSFIVVRYKPKSNNKVGVKENIEIGTFDPVAYNCSAVECKEDAQGQATPSQDNYQQDKNVPYQKENQNKPQRFSDFDKQSLHGLSKFEGNHGSMVTAQPLVITKMLTEVTESIANICQQIPTKIGPEHSLLELICLKTL